MNTSLYVLATEYELIANKLMELELDETTIADTLESVSGDLEVKATNVAYVIRNIEANNEQIKLAIKQMTARLKSNENKADAIRDYLKTNMQRCGITKIESPHFVLSLKKNPHKLVIDDAGAIPCELYVYPEPPAPYPNNELIKEKLKAGEIIDGAHLEQGERLEIK